LIGSLPRPSVILVLGRRGSGKDVTAHQIARIMKGTPIDYKASTNVPKVKGRITAQYKKYIYISLNPKKYFLPSYFREFKEVFLNDSVLLLHDAHIDLYAREWGTDFNKTMDKLQSISRHKNIDIVYTTQQARRLDVNIVAGSDALVFKEPSLLAPSFERPQLRDLSEKATTYFRGKSKRWKWEHAYVFTHVGEVTVSDIKKPYYWSEDLSRVYGQEQLEEPKKEYTTIQVERR